MFQLENFRHRRRCGRRMTLRRQDKGHKACPLVSIRAVEKGGPAPIAFEEVLEVNHIAIELATR
jgi:hypothetical protein